MADVHTPEQRRYNMSRIRSKNTKPEELVRKYLFSKGFRYRKNDARLVPTSKRSWSVPKKMLKRRKAPAKSRNRRTVHLL